MMLYFQSRFARKDFVALMEKERPDIAQLQQAADRPPFHSPYIEFRHLNPEQDQWIRTVVANVAAIS